MKKYCIFVSLLFVVTLFVSCKKNDEMLLVEYPNPIYSKENKIELDNHTNRIKNNPEDVNAYLDRARLEVSCADYKNAIKDFNKAVEIEPADYRTFYGRAMFECYYIGAFMSAKRDIDKVISLVPNNARAYRDRCEINERLADYSSALNDCNKAIELDSNNYDYYDKRANIKRYFGDKKGAIDDYTKALELAPYRIDIYRNKGQTIDVRDDYEQAVELFKKITELTPKDADAYDNYANSLRNFGKLEDAIDAYKKAVELNPNHMYAYTNLARAQKEKGDFNGALVSLEKAQELDVNSKDIQNQINELKKQIEEQQPKEIELSLTKTTENEESK